MNADALRFLVAHAQHPDWRAALSLATVQLQAAADARPADAPALTLGFVYFSDHYAAHAQDLLRALQQQWPGLSWVGGVGIGIAAQGVEYIDEPALALMLAPLPAAQFRVFSGANKLQRIEPFSALVHADPETLDLAELIDEMSARTASGYLFGGLTSSRSEQALVADGVWQGGLSGVAFTQAVPMLSRVTQGCQPLGATREVTACDGNLVLELDGRPALACLMEDLGLATLNDPRSALPQLRATLVGLTDQVDSALSVGGRRGSQFGAATRVRHLIGLDPARQAVAVGDKLMPGMRLAFCQRDVAAARRDLVRICSEIRDELDEAAELRLTPGEAAAPRQRILGGIYVSCLGRGGAHFGGPSAEMQIVQHALGASAGEPLPLVGFFASGEIARHHLYGYTGVLTVFTSPA